MCQMAEQALPRWRHHPLKFLIIVIQQHGNYLLMRISYTKNQPKEMDVKVDGQISRYP